MQYQRKECPTVLESPHEGKFKNGIQCPDFRVREKSSSGLNSELPKTENGLSLKWIIRFQSDLHQNPSLDSALKAGFGIWSFLHFHFLSLIFNLQGGNTKISPATKPFEAPRISLCYLKLHMMGNVFVIWHSPLWCFFWTVV
jgi:hypothetical protein